MASWGKTSIVYNHPSKLIGLPPYYYRLRSCDTNMTSNTPANQYQIQKQIQNTVRVYSSLYTSNLGPLSAYKRPISDTDARLYGVCWNQMSDRPVPSVQRATIPTGFANSLNNRHNSVTSSRPGCQTPGGVGCDIKHNSYDRYLNRLKAKGPLRRGYVPPGFGAPIPFNPAFPIYGGKTVKTNIIDGCDCPIQDKQSDLLQDIRLYRDPLIQPEPSGTYAFQVGDYVYAVETGTKYYSKATVIEVNGNIYTIEFEDGTIEEQNINQLLVYFPCNCTIPISATVSSPEFTPYTQTALQYLKNKTGGLCDNTIIDFTKQY
jgi:hypothetical protein